MDIVTAMFSFGWADEKTIQSYISPGRTEAEQQKAFSTLNVELEHEENAEEDLEPDLT